MALKKGLKGCEHETMKTRGIPNNIIIVELLQQTDLTNGCAGHAFVFRFQPYLLQCYNLVVCHIASFIHNAIGPCVNTTRSQTIQELMKQISPSPTKNDVNHTVNSVSCRFCGSAVPTNFLKLCVSGKARPSVERQNGQAEGYTHRSMV